VEIRVRGATPVLVGLERVGLLGLDRAIAAARESGLVEREELVDRMMAVLREQNYVPAKAVPEYRRAVWREYERSRGADISHLYSEIPVEVRASGAEAESFLDLLRRIFAAHELQPIVSLEPLAPGDRGPQLRIDDEVVVDGTLDPGRVSTAVSRRIGDW